MDFYSNTHQAPVLSSAELQQLNISSDQLQGFMRFGDMLGLIDRTSGFNNGMGIRVYKTITELKIVFASAVLASGFDDGFIGRSPDIEKSVGLVTRDVHPNSEKDIQFLIDSENPVTAYFSNAMLATIRQNNPTAAGLSFYLVDLANVADQHLQLPLQEGQEKNLVTEKGRIQSFVAIASEIDADGKLILPTDFNDPNKVMLSNMPTPGYALSVRVTFEVDIEPSQEINHLSSKPYLVPWKD